MSNKLTVGFIGCGRISFLHELGYRKNPHAQLTSVCCRNLSDLKKASKKWNITKTHQDYTELLKDNTIDLVEILTPHSTHFQITKDSLNAGKHVSLQKVPTLKLSEYDDLVTLAKKKKLRFRVYENFRYYPPYQEAKLLIESGVIGDILSVNQRMWVGMKGTFLSETKYLKSWVWRLKENENYSLPTLFDDGYHKHSIASFYLPDKITSVYAWRGSYKIAGVVDIDSPAIVLYRTKKSTTYGTLNITNCQNLKIKTDDYPSDEFVEITGTKGIMFIYGCTGNLFTNGNNNRSGAQIQWVDENGDWHKQRVKKSSFKDSFISATYDFIQSIRDNKEPQFTNKDAREVLKIDLAIVKSVREGREVQVSEITDGID